MTDQTETIPVVGDPAAQRDQLAAMAAEALSQRDRLLFTLGAVLEQFPPSDMPGDQRFREVQSKPVQVSQLWQWREQIHALKSIDTTPLALVALASTTADQPARVPDLPCPKCGDADVRVRYCDACKSRMSSDPCAHRSPEHFHRSCRRCGYGWQTDDVFDAKVVCEW